MEPIFQHRLLNLNCCEGDLNQKYINVLFTKMSRYHYLKYHFLLKEL